MTRFLDLFEEINVMKADLESQDFIQDCQITLDVRNCL